MLDYSHESLGTAEKESQFPMDSELDGCTKEPWEKVN